MSSDRAVELREHGAIRVDRAQRTVTYRVRHWDNLLSGLVGLALAAAGAVLLTAEDRRTIVGGFLALMGVGLVHATVTGLGRWVRIDPSGISEGRGGRTTRSLPWAQIEALSAPSLQSQAPAWIRRRADPEASRPTYLLRVSMRDQDEPVDVLAADAVGWFVPQHLVNAARELRLVPAQVTVDEDTLGDGAAAAPASLRLPGSPGWAWNGVQVREGEVLLTHPRRLTMRQAVHTAVVAVVIIAVVLTPIAAGSLDVGVRAAIAAVATLPAAVAFAAAVGVGGRWRRWVRLTSAGVSWGRGCDGEELGWDRITGLRIYRSGDPDSRSWTLAAATTDGLEVDLVTLRTADPLRRAVDEAGALLPGDLETPSR
ncbi:MAG: hypothetical protein M3N57_07905 [Actinomycetota bacterium]|nr:hypothetical protein [Actinomycetota bacterium]